MTVSIGTSKRADQEKVTDIHKEERETPYFRPTNSDHGDQNHRKDSSRDS